MPVVISSIMFRWNLMSDDGIQITQKREKEGFMEMEIAAVMKMDMKL